MSFRMIHMADSHNGYNGNPSRYNEYGSLRVQKVTDQGINVRQDDIDRAFAQVVDKAIALQVDAVVHAGDLFDLWGYKQPYVYNVIQEQVVRLTEQGIAFVVIIGNHDLPKVSGKGCYLESLGRLPGVFVAYKGIYETISLPQKNVIFHCVPSTFTQDILDQELAKVQPVPGKWNIGIGHFGVTSIKHYAENAIHSLVVDLDDLLRCRMDYFALGDYHVPTDFGHGIRYAGSIERMGFDEISIQPQVLLVEMESVADGVVDKAMDGSLTGEKTVRVQPLPLVVRDMIDLPSIDAKNQTVEWINQEIVSRIERHDITDKIVRLAVRNLPAELKRMVDTQKIAQLTNDRALYFKLDLIDKTKDMQLVRSSGVVFEGVLDGWHAFAAEIPEDGTFHKQALVDLGYHKLAEAMENADS